MYGLLGELVFVFLEVPVVFVLTVVLLLRYGMGHGSLSWIVVGVAWFVSMLIPALVSLDVAETLVTRCMEAADNASSTCPPHTANAVMIKDAWFVIYWLSFFLSWFFLPIVASYAISGAFGPLKKLRSALKDRLLLWGGSILFMLVCAGFLTYQFNLTWFAIMGILESLANSFGLLVVIVMLGHGLVEVPRYLWQSANHDQQLKSIECRATELTERIEDARSSLAQVLGQVEATRKKFAEIRSEFPLEVAKRLATFISVVEGEVPQSDESLSIPKPVAADPPAEISESSLEQLRRQVITKVIEFKKVNYIWQSNCRIAFEIQDLILWKTAALPASNGMRQFNFALRSFVLPGIFRVLALIGLCTSVLVTFAEVTVWTVQPPLQTSMSPFERVIHEHGRSVLFVQLFSFGTVSYMALCTFFSLFRFKLFTVYEPVPHHTDVYTLFINSMFCCRVAPVLAYNFLTVIHETNFAVDLLFGHHSARTSYSVLAQSLEQVPIFGVGFNLYFPSLLLLFVLLNITDFWSWIVRKLGSNFAKLTFYGEETAEDRKRGKRLLAAERKRWARRSLVTDLSSISEVSEEYANISGDDGTAHRELEEGAALALPS